jgi:hypothetical protein
MNDTATITKIYKGSIFELGVRSYESGII